MKKSALVELIESEARSARNLKVGRPVAVTIKLTKLKDIDQADDLTMGEFKSLWGIEMRIIREKKQAIFHFTPNGAFFPKQARPTESAVPT